MKVFDHIETDGYRWFAIRFEIELIIELIENQLNELKKCAISID